MMIGEIYLMHFGHGGSEQNGWRPGLIIQNNIGNEYSPNIIALPLTTAIKKTDQPTHVLIPKEVGLKKDSIVLCENPETMSKSRIGKFVVKLPRKYMEKVAIGFILSTGLVYFTSPDMLLSLWQKSESMNK